MAGPWVLKLGGDVVRDAEGLEGLAAEIRDCHISGQPLVIVHGGGPQGTAIMNRLGLEPRFAGGRRITDESTLEAMVMALPGQTSTALTAILTKEGVPALGVSGVSSFLVEAEKRPPREIVGHEELVDFGLVGDIRQVNTKAIMALIEAGFVPVIACLGMDRQGQVLNINADVVAVDLAARLKAELLVAVAGVPGVLADPSDMDSRFSQIDETLFAQQIEAGTIQGGMIAKLEEAFRAREAGIEQVLIAGPPHNGLLQACLAGEAGTRVL